MDSHLYQQPQLRHRPDDERQLAARPDESRLRGYPAACHRAAVEELELCRGVVWHGGAQRLYSTQGVAYDNNFVPTPGEKVTWGEVFDPFSEAVLGKKVAVIGHFPFAPKALHNAGEFYMLERHLNEGDFPIPRPNTFCRSATMSSSLVRHL